MDPHLLLAAAEGLGPTEVAPLLDPDLDPSAALGCPPAGLPPAALLRLRERAWLERKAAAWIRAAQALGLRLLTPADEGYPERLRHAPLRPLVLFARGDLALLASRSPSLALVGSRTPTPYGVAAAEDFAARLATAGVVLWSGLAYGIDAIAHRQALAAGTPTVAVLAGGLDVVYPALHAELAEQVVARGGLLLGEAPPGQRATRGHFPRRNRILATAARGVLVLEAGLASGSLITARRAAEIGTPVWAVPGAYTSPRSRGCHELIAEGAGIALDPEHLLRELGIESALRDEPHALEQSADASAILRAVASGPRPKDLVQREARLERGAFLRALSELIAVGELTELPGDLLALRSGRPLLPARRPRVE